MDISDKKTKLRIFLIFFIVLAVLSIARMFVLALRDYKHPIIHNISKRGDIYDRDGHLLTDNILTYSVCVDKTRIESASEAINLVKKLSPLLSMTPSEVAERIDSRRDYVVISRRRSASIYSNINNLKQKDDSLKSVYFQKERKRVYPYGELFAHIIGFTDIDNNGTEGLEYAFDEYLNTKKRDERLNLRLSTSVEMQTIVQTEVMQAVEKTKSESAVVIVEDVTTGAILAVSSYPFFNPNYFTRYDYKTIRNRAFIDTIEPGSTFKIFAGAFAVENNLVSSNEIFTTPGYYEYEDGHRIRDSVSNRSVNFEEIFKYSCNYGIIKIAEDRFERDAYYRFLNRFRFGEKTGIKTAGESAGILRPPRKWSRYSKGYISIGQEIAVTPLQLVNAYAALVNGGVLPVPYLVADIIDENGNIYEKISSKGTIVLEKRVSEAVTNLLAKGVERGSTGHLAALKNVGVFGKTGTAQIADIRAGGYLEDAYHSIFVGAFPLHEPRVAIIVVLSEPKVKEYSGGKLAAPLFRSIALQIIPFLNIYPNVEKIEDDFFDEYLNFLKDLSSTEGQNIMPNLEGLPLRDAILKISSVVRANNCEVFVRGNGYVIEQSPKADETVSRKSQIHIRLSPKQ